MVHLLLAAGDFYRAFVTMLLDAGVPVNAQNGRGETALSRAIGHGRPPIAELLHARGARIGMPELLQFASSRDPGVREQLTSRSLTRDQATQLLPNGAAYLDTVEFLLASGAEAASP
jgi:hypothetical protein